jgi:HSP20 family protein
MKSMALAPMTGLTNLRTEMDRLLDRFWETPEMPATMEWVPAIDVSEQKEMFLVQAEIPGIEPKDVEIMLRDQVLTIQGQKKQEKEEKTENYYHRERSQGTFLRRIQFPVPVDAKKVSALFRNGLLTITLPKMQGSEGTHIPIKTEQ